MNHKIAVITGGSSGIGLAVIKKLCLQNYTVINLDRNPPEEKLDSEFLQLDISNTLQVNAAIESIVQTHKTISYLFSNAGVHFSGNLEETSIEAIDNVINVNLKGTLYILKAILPYMRKQKFGRIVLNSSDQALVGKANSTIYGATKAATSQIAKSVAIDYSRYNININAVCPGTIDTPLYRAAVKRYCERTHTNLDDVHHAEAQLQLVERLGKPEEVANLVAFLFSDEANFITGTNISIDGGYTAK